MTTRSLTRLAFVIPVYNDWLSFQMLVERIDSLVSSWNAEIAIYRG